MGWGEQGLEGEGIQQVDACLVHILDLWKYTLCFWTSLLLEIYP